MRYDSEWKERTRQRVLGEAAKAIRQEGAQGVGVASVMARAGLTHGAFYAHFDSKDAMIGEAISLMIDQVRQRFMKVTDGLPPADALRAYVDFYLSPRHRDGTSVTCPLPLVAADVARLGTASQRRYGEGVAGLVAALSAQIDALGRPDAPALASSVTAEMIGAMTLARGLADRADSDLLLARSRAAVLARLGLAGDGGAGML